MTRLTNQSWARPFNQTSPLSIDKAKSVHKTFGPKKRPSRGWRLKCVVIQVWYFVSQEFTATTKSWQEGDMDVLAMESQNQLMLMLGLVQWAKLNEDQIFQLVDHINADWLHPRLWSFQPWRFSMDPIWWERGCLKSMTVVCSAVSGPGLEWVRMGLVLSQ